MGSSSCSCGTSGWDCDASPAGRRKPKSSLNSLIQFAIVNVDLVWSAPDPWSLCSPMWCKHLLISPLSTGTTRREHGSKLSGLFGFSLGFHPPTTTPFTALPRSNFRWYLQRNDVSYTHVILWSLNILRIKFDVAQKNNLAGFHGSFPSFSRRRLTDCLPFLETCELIWL